MENLKEQYKKAIDCNNCFNNLDIKRGKVRAAQPRWIGENYFDAKQRICILMINPGDVGPKPSVIFFDPLAKMLAKVLP